MLFIYFICYFIIIIIIIIIIIMMMMMMHPSVSLPRFTCVLFLISTSG